jgi:hypothetical protein
VPPAPRQPWWHRHRVTAIALGGLALVLLLVAVLGREERHPPPLGNPTILQDDAELLHRSTARVRADMRTLRRLGVDWVRLTAGWSVIAPAPGARRAPHFDATDPAAYPPGAWAQLDRAVRLARAAGLQVLIDIAFWAPRWATSAPSRPRDRQRTGIDPAAYGRFAKAVARRYSGDYGDIPGAIAFSVWNEPNFGAFLLPQWVRRGSALYVASAHRYRAMLYAAVPAIRQEAPAALVLIGGLAATALGSGPPTSRGVPPLQFLRELACVDQRLQPLDRPECRDFKGLPGDAFSLHPYSTGMAPWQHDPDPDDVPVADLHRLTRLLARLHRQGRTESALPVLLTEYGYETNPPDPTQTVSPAQQARYLVAAQRIARATPGVRGWPQILLRDLGPVAGARGRARWSDFQTGLLYADGQPKPAFRAFRRIAREAG